ncbi:MAG: hypothetical protein H0W68_04870 [Gemmatimonadaceae bacterium]|nr:hypothetical protein [Gemmatimonadaceae bacterium]
MLRVDLLTASDALPGTQRLVVAGIEYTPTARTALSLDLQDLSARDYRGRSPVADTRSLALHWSANF